MPHAKQERTSRVINVQETSIGVYYSRHGQKGLFPARDTKGLRKRSRHVLPAVAQAGVAGFFVGSDESAVLAIPSVPALH
jgi:hypothetical protein